MSTLNFKLNHTVTSLEEMMQRVTSGDIAARLAVKLNLVSIVNVVSNH